MMEKDIEWLKDRILRSKGTCIFMRDNSEPHGGGRRFYSGMLTSIDLILGFIDQLDEPEIDQVSELESYVDDLIRYNTQLKNELREVRKNDESEGLLDEMDKLIRRAIDAETTSQTIEMLTGMTIEQVAEGFRDGKFDPKEELTMAKLETLVVPTDLGEWLQSREIGESGAYFSTIDGLFHYWDSESDTAVFNFISQNKKELIEVILGTRGYRVDKPLYHALIKGHELVHDDDIYWNYDKSNHDVFVSRLHPPHANFTTEMTEQEWFEVGINDSNADFIRADGVEE